MIGFIIDPLSIATEGFIQTNEDGVADTLAIATMGFIVEITEEIIDPPVIPQGGGGSGPGAGIFDGRKVPDSRYKLKKITAKITYQGKTYTDSVTVHDLTLTARDVNIIVDDTDAANITIKVKLKDDVT